MSKRRLIDTNLILRHLVADHESHTKAAMKLFQASDRGEMKLVILPTVLAECVFVLASFYKYPRSQIVNAMVGLITSPGIEVEQMALHIDALERYRTSKVHFVDCLLAAHAVASDLAIATFDADFKRFADITVAID